MRAGFIGSALILSVLPIAASAEPMLLISIDGLRPADVIDADSRKIEIPNLRRFIKEGIYASGVVGVLPTVTYPSHAALLTGTSPEKNGIIGNTSFDPMQINQAGWYWYATDFKVPTLWDAASKSGMTTANVHWPVSVRANSITWNLPQIWRTGHADDNKLMKALASSGLIERLEAHVGTAYAQGIDESIDGDENRGQFAAALITMEQPEFTTVYLTALDHEQHLKGPGSADAHAVLQRIDRIVGQLLAAQFAAHPDSVIAIVSDHGFSNVDTEVNLYRAFIDSGLITLDDKGKIKSWEASPWNSGGSSAIMLSRPDDAALNEKVRGLLVKLQTDPANCIAKIVGRDGIKAMDGNSAASFYVDFESNAFAGGFKGKDAPMVSPSESKGSHGYFPANSLMRSTFMMMGHGVPKGRDLGEINIRAIAPTLAVKMQVLLPDAELPPIPGL